jgi:transporter family protein
MEYLLFAIVALLGFGFHDFSVKLLSAHVPSALIAGIAGTIGGVCILVYALAQGMVPQADRFTVYAGLIGLLFGISYVAYVTAIAKGPLSVAMPIVALWFLIPAILGIIFLREGITVTKMAGIAMAGGAIFLLTR